MADDDVIPTTPIKRTKTHRQHTLAGRDVRFCVLCLEYQSATKAYLEVFARDGISHESARSGAARVMRRPAIRRYMRKLFDDAAACAGVGAQQVIAKAIAITFTNWSVIYEKDGRVKPFDEWPPGLIEHVKIETRMKYKRVKNNAGGWVKKYDGHETIVKTPDPAIGLGILARLLKLVGNDAIDPNADKFRPMVIGGEADLSKI